MDDRLRNEIQRLANSIDSQLDNESLMPEEEYNSLSVVVTKLQSILLRFDNLIETKKVAVTNRDKIEIRLSEKVFNAINNKLTLYNKIEAIKVITTDSSILPITFNLKTSKLIVDRIVNNDYKVAFDSDSERIFIFNF